MTSIAHIRSSDKEIQTVEEHLTEVCKLCEIYGRNLQLSHVTGLAGLLHDLGKYTDEFSTYITTAVNMPEKAPAKGSVDHSSAGGAFLYSIFHSNPAKNEEEVYRNVLVESVGNAIVSHHGYLKDFISPSLQSGFLQRVTSKDKPHIYESLPQVIEKFYKNVMSQEDFESYIDKASREVQVFLEANQQNQLTATYFLTLFVFSSLIDADRTNTREFEEGKIEKTVDSSQFFGSSYDFLIEYLNKLSLTPSSQTPINLLRRKMSHECESFAEKPSGIYTLSIPTGGGKTLASLRYALKHSLLYQKKRIFYIIPYTTIIEQNASEVRQILRDSQNVVEHHSNMRSENQGSEIRQAETLNEWDEITQSKSEQIRLVQENWDGPIIFTTMVQFLNAFYAKGGKYARRMHNLSDSVIIFDEVQKVPLKCLSLFNEAVNFLKDNANASILMCTATQPSLDGLKRSLKIGGEIVGNLEEVADSFKRTDIVEKVTEGRMGKEKLSTFVKDILTQKNSLLIILNTKKVVRELYFELKEETTGQDILIYHLSTSMCPEHRRNILREIKENLKAKEKRIICISTQLIEAGVDISFSCVIRSLAGLDSIAQAAGRCNRNGESPSEQVFIIDYEEENLDKLKEIQLGAEVTRMLLINRARNDEKNDLLAPAVMREYFKRYYHQISQLQIDNYNTERGYMTDLLFGTPFAKQYISKDRENNRKSIPCIQAAHDYASSQFEVIDQGTQTVIVPYGKGKEVIAELGSENIDDLNSLLKEGQQYSVNVYRHTFEKLMRSQSIIPVFDGNLFVARDYAYNEEFGLDEEGMTAMDLAVF